MKPKLIVHQWKHPYKGNITEVLCNQHGQEVMAALSVLSIGSGAREARANEGECTRCTNNARKAVIIGAESNLEVP